MKSFLTRIDKKYVFALVSVVIAVTAHAQNLPVDSLQQKFITYQQNNYNEKIFVHTDKTFYIAGESIWYKIYCVDGYYHKPSDISKVAYVEILDAGNDPILQAKISLDKGSGNGSFIVPSYIVSGNYIIRAYTKWMQNFDAGYFFEEPLTIINTLKPGVVKNEIKKKSWDVSFFPEGGNLVEGITSKVAFKIIDERGEPVDCIGTVNDSENNVVAGFRSFKFGMGSFWITPKAPGAYKAVIKVADTIITKQLPSVYQQGFVMHVENADDAHIKINVSASGAGNNNKVYLLVHSQNTLKDFQQNNLSNDEVVFITDKTKLADGINTITVFNSERQPVCERLYFKKPVSNLSIQSQTDKGYYTLRKPVHISVTATGISDLPAEADLSAAVFMIDSLQPAAYTDILSYLLLSSELKGNITSPAYYFQSNSKEAEDAADDLMLTQGWRRFKWDDILQDKKPYFDFIPDYEGFVIDGMISSKFNGLPAPGITVTLTAPGENFQLAKTVSNTSGNLIFNVKKFYGTDNIIIQSDSNYKATVSTGYSNKFSMRSFPVFTMPLQWKDQLLFRSINTQADNSFLVKEKQHSYLYHSGDTSLFYGAPDKRYYLDDYTRFTTMEEVMREYVAEVQVRKESSQFHFRVFDFLTKTFSDNDPLILLDGLPVSNANNIIKLDPLKIKKLDVVARKYYYGNIMAGGIVSYTTYRSDLADFPLSAGEVVVKFDGLQREREFYSPVYDSMQPIQNHLPDLRNVLYWLPELKTSADGKANLDFYTSDITGKFACVLQGITADGLAGSSIVTFEVGK